MSSIFSPRPWRSTVRASAVLLSGFGAYLLSTPLNKSRLDEVAEQDGTEKAKIAAEARKQREIAKAAEGFCAFADSSPSGNAHDRSKRSR
jgi:hypothetical protein